MLQSASVDARNGDVRRSSRPADAPVQYPLLRISSPGNQAMLRLQRKCECGGGPDCDCDSSTEKKRTGELHRSAAGPATPQEAPPIVHEVLRSPGQMLDPETRAFFEARFSRDFSSVRVHTDSRAAESARAVHSHAYTVGRDIAFAPGRFSPATAEGRRLLAHELTHTVQQSSPKLAAGGQIQTQIAVEQVDDPLERDADAAAARVMHAPYLAGPLRVDAPVLSAGNRQVQRQAESPSAAGLAGPAAVNQPQQSAEAGNRAGCVPGAGKPPSDANCRAYAANAAWLPSAYVVNARCACLSTPDSPTANCVRQSLQDRLAATPASIKAEAAAASALSLLPGGEIAYEAFVQSVLTPRIYRDHVDSYRACCCPSGPAPYAAWVGVTTVPIPVCGLVGASIRQFGSCHGTPGAW